MVKSNATGYKWSDDQIKYFKYLARGKKDLQGNLVTKKDFASAIGVSESTIYDWQNLPGFGGELYYYSMAELTPFLPQLNAAIIGKSLGKKEFAKADTSAYMALMRQFELLKSDKIDHTSNGKQLPTPIVSITSMKQSADELPQ